MGKELTRLSDRKLRSTYYFTDADLQKRTSLDTLFASKAEKNKFNGCVLIAQGKKIIYKKCFGYAVYEKQMPLTLSTAFQLASTSKPITATAIMILKEQGKLSFSDNVKKYFPDFPYENITIQQLLTHRSGLGNYIYFMESDYPDEGKLISNETVLNYIIEKKPGKYFIPDKKFEYNNTNYVLLACLVEKIAGISFPEFVQREIFDKCDMKTACVKTRNDTVDIYNSAIGYQKKNDKKDWERVKQNFADGVYGDKNVYASVIDLYKYENALCCYKLLKKETLDEAYKGYSFEKPGNRNYGYGWRLFLQKDTAKIIYHNGWWHGFNTAFYRRPSDHTVIIVLSNKLNRSIYHVQDVFAILDGKSGSVFEFEQPTGQGGGNKTKR